MIAVEGFPCKFFIEFGIRMFVHFNHDEIRNAIIAFGPVAAVSYAAFYIRHRLHLPPSFFPFADPGILSKTYSSTLDYGFHSI